jgi:hypothetical protein
MDRKITILSIQINNIKFIIWILKQTHQIIFNKLLSREKAYNTMKKKQVGFQWACITKATKTANKLVNWINNSYGIIKLTPYNVNRIIKKWNS